MQLESVITNEYEWLLYRLWVKENPEPISFNFRIPETVVYKVNKPYAYYFSSKENHILRKYDKKLSKKFVYDQLLTKAKPHQEFAPIATALFYQNLRDRVDVLVNHLTINTIKNFIFEQDKLHLDLLVEYVPSTVEKNTLIKCQWTPSVCMIETRENKFVQEDLNLPMLQKVVTYEGPQGLSTTNKIISTFIIKEIERACRMIQEKLSQSDVVLTQATYYFKIKKSVLYLTACSNLNIEGELYKSKVNHNKPVVFRIPEEDNLSLFKDVKVTNKELIKNELQPMREAVDNSRVKCAFCQIQLQQGHFENYEFMIKQILLLYTQYTQYLEVILQNLTGEEDYEIEEKQQYLKLLEQVQNEAIPFPIKKMYPKLTWEQYQRNVRDYPEWVYESRHICSQCFSLTKQIQEDCPLELSSPLLTRQLHKLKHLVYLLTTLFQNSTMKPQALLRTTMSKFTKESQEDKVVRRVVDQVVGVDDHEQYKVSLYKKPYVKNKKLLMKTSSHLELDPLKVKAFIDVKMCSPRRKEIVRRNISGESKRVLLEEGRPKSTTFQHRKLIQMHVPMNATIFSKFKQCSQVPQSARAVSRNDIKPLECEQKPYQAQQEAFMKSYSETLSRLQQQSTAKVKIEPINTVRRQQLVKTDEDIRSIIHSQQSNVGCYTTRSVCKEEDQERRVRFTKVVKPQEEYGALLSKQFRMYNRMGRIHSGGRNSKLFQNATENNIK